MQTYRFPTDPKAEWRPQTTAAKTLWEMAKIFCVTLAAQMSVMEWPADGFADLNAFALFLLPAGLATWRGMNNWRKTGNNGQPVFEWWEVPSMVRALPGAIRDAFNGGLVVMLCVGTMGCVSMRADFHDVTETLDEDGKVIARNETDWTNRVQATAGSKYDSSDSNMAYRWDADGSGAIGVGAGSSGVQSADPSAMMMQMFSVMLSAYTGRLQAQAAEPPDPGIIERLVADPRALEMLINALRRQSAIEP
jgi:hypothetical protein